MSPFGELPLSLLFLPLWISYKNGPEHRNAAEPSHFLSERGAVSRMRQLGGDYAVFAPRILMTSPIRGPSRHRHPHSHCPYPTYHSYSPLATLGLPNTNYRMLLLIIVTRFFAFWAPIAPSEGVILLKRHGCKKTCQSL